MPPIPPQAHLIWLGSRLEALPYLAARSVLDRGGLERVVLHYEDPDLPEHPLARDLAARPGLLLRRVDPAALLAGAPPALRELDPRLTLPASRSDLLRLLILWKEGGVYLDADTVTLRPLTPLLSDPGFGGLERTALPAALPETRNPLRWAQAGALVAVRALIRKAFFDAGKAFQRVEQFFPLAAGNAVLGAHAGHPVLEHLLDSVAVMRGEEAVRPYRLGPQLLERVSANRYSQSFRLHPPFAFYPLPRNISAVYVRDDPDGRLGERPHPETYAAHVYVSVLTRQLGGPVDAECLARLRGRSLLTRMVEPYLDDLAAAQGRA
jgi:hypothetical protein